MHTYIIPLLGSNGMGHGGNKRVKCPQFPIHTMPAAEAGAAEVWAAPLGRAGLSQKL